MFCLCFAATVLFSAALFGSICFSVLVVFVCYACRYRDIFDALLRRGMSLNVTLWHFTHPQWFDELGGWTRAENIQLFVNYAVKVRHATTCSFAAAAAAAAAYHTFMGGGCLPFLLHARLEDQLLICCCWWHQLRNIEERAACLRVALLLLLLLLLCALQAVELFGDQVQLWATFNEPTVRSQ